MVEIGTIRLKSVGSNVHCSLGGGDGGVGDRGGCSGSGWNEECRPYADAPLWSL